MERRSDYIKELIKRVPLLKDASEFPIVGNVYKVDTKDYMACLWHSVTQDLLRRAGERWFTSRFCFLAFDFNCMHDTLWPSNINPLSIEAGDS
jgi:hypothetical protein